MSFIIARTKHQAHQTLQILWSSQPVRSGFVLNMEAVSNSNTTVVTCSPSSVASVGSWKSEVIKESTPHWRWCSGNKQCHEKIMKASKKCIYIVVFEKLFDSWSHILAKHLQITNPLGHGSICNLPALLSIWHWISGFFAIQSDKHERMTIQVL